MSNHGASRQPKYRFLPKLSLLIWACLCSGVFNAPPVIAKEDENPVAEASGHGLRSVTEIMLPPFQASTLTKDLPLRDSQFQDDDTLMILGETSLWQWHLGDRQLRRLVLREPRDDVGKSALHELASDGISLFAVSDETLMQVQWGAARILRYRLPYAGPALAGAEGVETAPNATNPSFGFAGMGDDFWVVQAAGLAKFDRYGKTLVPQLRTPYLRAGDHVVFDPPGHQLWFARGNRLFHVDLGGYAPIAATPGASAAAAPGTNADQVAPATAPELVLQAKHQIRDLQRVGKELVAHTRYAVLRLGSDGHLRQSIPVEGHRQLVLMLLQPNVHAYLFNDQLLEIFHLAEHRVERFHLPLETSSELSHLRLSQSMVSVMEGGQPRVFHLNNNP